MGKIGVARLPGPHGRERAGPAGARLSAAARVASLALAVVTLNAVLALPRHAEKAAEIREVVVNVIDRTGDQPAGLTAKNFRGTCRGKPVRIVSARLDSRPRRVAVVVDNSASMDEKHWTCWKTTEDLVSVLTPYNTAVILTLSDRLETHSDLSNDPEVLQRGLGRARAAGYTGPSALYDGLVRVSRDVGARWDAGDVLAVVTDAEDTASRLSGEASVPALARAAIRVCVLWLANGKSPSRSDAESWVRGVVEATGGFLMASDAGGIDALRTLASRLVRAYRLEVMLPEGADVSGKWELKAVDQDTKELEGVTVVYPHLVASLSRLVPQPGETPPAQPLPGNVPCAYPAEAQRNQVAGPVLYTARVQPDGRVKSVDIRQVPAERLGFEEAVRTCVSAWRFEPMTAGGGLRRYDGKVQYRIAITEEIAIRALLEAFAMAWNAKNADAIGALQGQTQEPGAGGSGSLPSLLEQFTKERTTADWNVELEPVFQQIRFLRPDVAVIEQPFHRRRSGDTASPADTQPSLLEATAIKRGESWTLLAWYPITGPPPGPSWAAPGIEQPRKAKHVDPIYPERAAQALVQGVVLVEFVISPRGGVSDARALGGPALLADAAVSAVRQWEYTPVLLAGVPIPVASIASIEFHWDSSRGRVIVRELGISRLEPTGTATPPPGAGGPPTP
jgi:TonB family protein